MLVVHWSPVQNTRRILRMGIRKGERGTFCFPLTGHTCVDRWWAQAFRRWRPRTQYNGFVFRLVEEDMPATFGHWLLGLGNEPRFDSLTALEAAYRSSVFFRLGEAFARHPDADYETLGAELVAREPELYSHWMRDAQWVRWVFEDYEIKIARSISADRILRTITGSNESGRQRVRRFRNRQQSKYDRE